MSSPNMDDFAPSSEPMDGFEYTSSSATLSDVVAFSKTLQEIREPEAAQAEPPQATPLVVTGPGMLKRMIDSQYAISVDVLPTSITFRLPSAFEFRRRNILVPHEEISKRYVHNIIFFIGQLRCTAKRRADFAPEANPWYLDLTLDGFSGLCLPPDLILPPLDENAQDPVFDNVHGLTLRNCAFDNMQGIVDFFGVFPHVKRFASQDMRWPSLLQDAHPDRGEFPYDVFAPGAVLVNQRWQFTLQDVFVQVRSLGDIWLLHQLSKIVPCRVKRLVVEWDDCLRKGYVKHLLRTYVDLRDWLHLNHLTIRTILSPAACFDPYSTEIVDASALSIAVALIPAERPEYNVMSHDNWLERIDIDFRNVLSSPITLSGKPRQWAVKLEEDFNELLAQIATLKRNVSRTQLSDKEFGLWMDDYDPTQLNGVAMVVGLIDPTVKPTFAAGKGDWRLRYRSEWESDLDQKAGVRVRFEPFVEA